EGVGGAGQGRGIGQGMQKSSEQTVPVLASFIREVVPNGGQGTLKHSFLFCNICNLDGTPEKTLPKSCATVEKIYVSALICWSLSAGNPSKATTQEGDYVYLHQLPLC
ncbi:MAG: hypothetical protein AAFZ80_15020, partial [Cyanobacteria bacterium P01_A01_bin.105]